MNLLKHFKTSDTFIATTASLPFQKHRKVLSPTDNPSPYSRIARLKNRKLFTMLIRQEH